VSARRQNNATTWFKVTCTHGGRLLVRDNPGGREPKWNRAGVKKAGDNYEITLKAGQSLEAELAKPQANPPVPGDLAAPVVIKKSANL
jgi:hypothetical protein